MSKKKKMSLQELRDKLKKEFEENEPESAHMGADQLLLEYIGDKEVSEIFDSARKWYA